MELVDEEMCQIPLFVSHMTAYVFAFYVGSAKKWYGTQC